MFSVVFHAFLHSLTHRQFVLWVASCAFFCFECIASAVDCLNGHISEMC